MRKRTCTWQAPRRAAYPTNRLGRWRDLATQRELAIAHQAALHLAAIVIWARR
ncbi:hypothetical protein ACFVZR_15845 [Streptomyces sp. NPDC058316]|uniref:hypothetical protein n=1 Tax=unclassified Streptomyces TaxID=2593676 RepID=UPI0036E6D931